jgi:hypothetical protein
VRERERESQNGVLYVCFTLKRENLVREMALLTAKKRKKEEEGGGK